MFWHVGSIGLRSRAVALLWGWPCGAEFLCGGDFVGVEASEMRSERNGEGRKGLDPKQVFFALVGAVLGVGFLFLVGSHVQKLLSASDETTEHKTNIGAVSSSSVAGAAHKVQVKQNKNDYAFFALLDKPAPRRDAPHLNLAPNPLQEKKTNGAKGGVSGEITGALTAKGGKGDGKGSQGAKKPSGKPDAALAKGSSSSGSNSKAGSGKALGKGSPQALGGKVDGELVLGGEGLSGAIGYQEVPESLLNADFGAKKPDGAAKAKGTGRSRFTVQVGSFQDQAVAEGLMADLSSRGYDAYLTPEQVPGKGTWYRVRMGRFQKREEAEQFSRKVKAEDGVGGFVTGM